MINSGMSFPAFQFGLEAAPLVKTVTGLSRLGDAQAGILTASPKHVQVRWYQDKTKRHAIQCDGMPSASFSLGAGIAFLLFSAFSFFLLNVA